MLDPKTLSAAKEIGAISCFAATAGALHYGLKVTEGHTFSFAELLLHIGTSAISGICSYLVCLSVFSCDPALSGALSGIAGWTGTRLLRIGEIVIRRKTEDFLGLERGELDKELKH